MPIVDAKITQQSTDKAQRVWMTGSKFAIPNGSLIDLDRPTPISWFTETSSEWNKIVTGPSFGVSWAPQGVYAWAYDSSSDKYIPPFRLDGPKSFRAGTVKDIACSSTLIFVLLTNGRIVTIDPVSQSMTNLPQPIIPTPSSWFRRNATVAFKSFSVGDNHLLAIDQFGNVWSSGSNTHGQCGVKNLDKKRQNRFVAQDDNNLDESLAQINFENFHKIYDASTFGSAVSVSAGGAHSVIRTSNGTLFSFGDDSKIQLGLGDTRSQEPFDYVPHSGMGNMEGASGTNSAIKFSESSPTVKYTFYESHIREKLTSIKIPEKYQTDNSFSEIYLGRDFTILQNENSGMLICCGENRFGQCGRGFNKQQQTFAPVKLPRDMKPNKISCGSSHCVTSHQDGTIYAWGNNDKGQLGTGSRAPVCPPQLIHRSKIRGFLREDIITKIGRGATNEEMESFLSEQKIDQITIEKMLETDKKKMLPDPLSMNPDRQGMGSTSLKTQLLDAIDKSRESHMMTENEQREWSPVHVFAGFNNTVLVMTQ